MKHLIVFVFVLTLAFTVRAQVYINWDQLDKASNVQLKMKVRDSRTKEPLSFATVYLTRQGDTTITNFTFTDENGKALVKDIIPGKYDVNIENIGYKSYKKLHDLNGHEVDLGTVDLEENPEYIDASAITAIVNPLTVKQDTLEYNAAAFRIGANDMLEDLLKKMPGMTVDGNGNVSVNGKKVDKLTVGGKTFFFNDPSVAVKNLPAQIVNKIRVIDKDKEEAAFTGIATDSDKEKVMDVELKEEYKEGWFGNAALAGGTNIMGKDDRQDRGLPAVLYNANAMVSGYSDNDQVVFLGSSSNSDKENGVIIFSSFGSMSLADDFSTKTGVKTAAQAGANYNTERIKDIETNASANYTYMNKDVRERTARTSFLTEGEELFGDSRYLGTGKDHKVNASFNMKKKDTHKYDFSIRPAFSYTRTGRNIMQTSQTLSAGEVLNSGESGTVSTSDNFTGSTELYFGIKDLGKKGRSLTFKGLISYTDIAGSSVEKYSTITQSWSESRNLTHGTGKQALETQIIATYVEPFSKNWKFMVRLQPSYSSLNSIDDAFNTADMSPNDYYSSISRSQDINLSERLLMQYKKGIYNVQFGVQFEQEQNIIYTKGNGLESTAGRNEWIMNYLPYLRINLKPERHSISLSYSGRSMSPYGQKISPVLNLSDPVRLSVGNVWLRPEFYHSSTLYWNGRTESNRLNISMNIYNQLIQNGIVTASWFDSEGVRYSIPVNSEGLGENTSARFDGTVSLDSKRMFGLNFVLSGNHKHSISYQSLSCDISIDRDAFDYPSLMDEFWGDSSGERFYCGKSGFQKSSMNTWGYGAMLSFTFRKDGWYFSLGGYSSNSRTKYSLDPKANMNTWDFEAKTELNWQSKNGWNISGDYDMHSYRGYSNGYGKPEHIVNLEVSKSIKAFTISLKCNDVLNQTRSLYRTTSAEYFQDVERNVIGRTILLGFRLNFGKMNASRNAKVRNAMFNMMF